MSEIRFDGRVAVITGAGGGLGRTYALMLASRGAQVVVNDLGGAKDGTGGGSSMADAVVKEITDAGGRAVASYDSVSTPEGGEGVIKTAMDAFGKVDIVINNAGMAVEATIVEMTSEQWRKVLDTDLDGVFHVGQEAARRMSANGGGSIVNIASAIAFTVSKTLGAYAVAKAGVVKLTEAMALELAPHRIRVNAIAPGLTDTAQPRYGMSEEEIAETASMTPLSGISEPEDIADLAVFLTSDAASRITGQTVHVNGGQYLY